MPTEPKRLVRPPAGDPLTVAASLSVREGAGGGAVLPPRGRRALLVALACLAGCAAPRSAPVTAGELPEAVLRGERIIGCCCPTPCPCRLNEKPTFHHGCDYTTAVHVEEGEVDGVSLDGLDFVIVGRSFAETPGAVSTGNWCVLYVDEDASPEQLAALQAFLGVEGAAAQARGRAPHLAGAFAGVQSAPIDYRISSDGRERACTIEGILELRTRAIVNPGRAEPVTSLNVLDSFGDRFVHGTTLAHDYRDPRHPESARDLTGRQSNYASFVLGRAELERLAGGSLGWSCWSANAAFGDEGPYGEDLVEEGCCGDPPAAP